MMKFDLRHALILSFLLHGGYFMAVLSGGSPASTGLSAPAYAIQVSLGTLSAAKDLVDQTPTVASVTSKPVPEKQEQKKQKKPPQEKAVLPQKTVLQQIDQPPQQSSKAQEKNQAASYAAASQGSVGEALQASDSMGETYMNLPVSTSVKFRVPPKPPSYPERALRLGQRGTALVRALVSEAGGRPSQVMIYQSSGAGALDQAALKAVSDWQFEAAESYGKKIASWVEVPVQFNLKH